MIAAHTSSTRAAPDEVRDFLSSLTTYVKSFSEGLVQSTPVGVEIMGVSASPTFTKERHTKDGSEDEIVVVEAPMLDKERANVDYIVRNFGYPEEDVKEWMSTVGYPVDVALVPLQVVVHTLELSSHLSSFCHLLLADKHSLLRILTYQCIGTGWCGQPTRARIRTDHICIGKHLSL